MLILRNMKVGEEYVCNESDFPRKGNGNFSIKKQMRKYGLRASDFVFIDIKKENVHENDSYVIKRVSDSSKK
jgi:hypothetical protein